MGVQWTIRVNQRPQKWHFFTFFIFDIFQKFEKSVRVDFKEFDPNFTYRPILGQKRDSWSFSPHTPREHPQIDDFMLWVCGRTSTPKSQCSQGPRGLKISKKDKPLVVAMHTQRHCFTELVISWVYIYIQCMRFTRLTFFRGQRWVIKSKRIFSFLSTIFPKIIL